MVLVFVPVEYVKRRCVSRILLFLELFLGDGNNKLKKLWATSGPTSFLLIIRYIDIILFLILSYLRSNLTHVILPISHWNHELTFECCIIVVTNFACRCIEFVKIVWRN